MHLTSSFRLQEPLYLRNFQKLQDTMDSPRMILLGAVRVKFPLIIQDRAFPEQMSGFLDVHSAQTAPAICRSFAEPGPMTGEPVVPGYRLSYLPKVQPV